MMIIDVGPEESRGKGNPMNYKYVEVTEMLNAADAEVQSPLVEY